MTAVALVADPPTSPWRGSDRGATREAQFIPRQVAAICESLIGLSLESGSRRRASREAILEAFKECSVPGWDGYGAVPANPDSASRAEAVVAPLLPTLGLPHYSFDPEGDALMEWYLAPDRVLDMSVGSNGEIRYAATIGGARQTGIEQFSDGLPSGILQMARRLAA